MAEKQFSRNLLNLSLLIYAIIVTFFAWLQADYICADFIAYVTVAKRTMAHPFGTVTSYWAPLFSWAMIPFLTTGLDDLVVGRLVLILSGFGYLFAIHRLTMRQVTGRPVADRMIQIGTMTCSVIQSTIWATYLLDPDLFANAFLYLYFCFATVSPSLLTCSRRSMLAGVLAGVSYLAKAYMLPFCVIHFLMTLGMQWAARDAQATAQPKHRELVRSISLFFLGLVLVAGPWIAAVSWKCGRPCFSSAGSANHANMGPGAFRNDPLWHPGLQRDYIFEPHLSPDWSPFRDVTHLLHQLEIVKYNVLNCIGLIPVWLVIFIGCLCKAGTGRQTRDPRQWRYLVWVAATVVLYCGGYTTVNLEARYIIPTVVPLLCHASLLVICPVLLDCMQGTALATNPDADRPERRWFESLRDSDRVKWFTTRPLLMAVLISLVFSVVDIDNLIRIATRHPQARKLETFRIVADQFRSSGLPDSSITCNDWHLGLYISYSADRLANYWGSPLSRDLGELVKELEERDAKVFLRFVRETDPIGYFPFTSPFVDHPEWTQELTIRDSRIAPDFVEVYVHR